MTWYEELEDVEVYPMEDLPDVPTTPDAIAEAWQQQLHQELWQHFSEVRTAQRKIWAEQYAHLPVDWGDGTRAPVWQNTRQAPLIPGLHAPNPGEEDEPLRIQRVPPPVTK